MKGLIGKLFGQGSRLSTLETRILNTIRNQFGPATAKLWDEQVHTINKVQRLPDGVEVNFYRMKGGHPIFDDALAFANKAEELKIATVQIRMPIFQKTLTASVWCVKGFLFSIEYKGSVRYFEEAAGMDSRPETEIQIDCKIEEPIGSD